MNILFNNISDAKAGYYDGLEFLDKQDEFNKLFSKNPALLPPNPTSVDSSTTAKLLLDFSELCRLVVNLYTYCKFYVGSSNIDKILVHRKYFEKYRTYVKNGKINMVSLSLMIAKSY